MKRVNTADSYLSQAIDCQQPETVTEVPKTPKTNVFSNLAIFFREEERVPKAKGGLLVVKGKTFVLPALLEDMLQRGLYGIDDLYQQLCHFLAVTQHTQNGRCLQEEYVAATYQTVARPHRWQSLSQDKQLQFVKLVTSTQGVFEKLFYCLLSTALAKCALPAERRSFNEWLTMFKNFLELVDMVDEGKSDDVFMERPLSFGQTPLDVASRHRNPHVVFLLLRHGVNIQTSWMNYSSSLQVLLFSPTVIFLDEEDEERIEQCLLYYTRAVRDIDCKALLNKAAAGYHPLHSRWRHLIPSLNCYQPQSLKHLCRHQIRGTLLQTGHIPQGVDQLPLPPLLTAYVDLQH